MRERNLFHLFLGLNVALAGAFVAYLFLAHSGQPKVVSTSFPTGARTNATTNAAPAGVAKAGDRKTNSPPEALVRTNEIQSAAPAKPKPAFTDKEFTWEQVESEEYRTTWRACAPSAVPRSGCGTSPWPTSTSCSPRSA